MYKTLISNKEVRPSTKEVRLKIDNVECSIFTDMTETHWISAADAFLLLGLLWNSPEVSLKEYHTPENQDSLVNDVSNVIFISERLFYKLLLSRSKRPHHHEMVHTLATKVLPNIRKAGYYALTDDNINTWPFLMFEVVGLDKKIQEKEDAGDIVVSEAPVQPAVKLEELTATPVPLETMARVDVSEILEKPIIMSEPFMDKNTVVTSKPISAELEALLSTQFVDNKETKKSRDMIVSIINAGPDGVLFTELCKTHKLQPPEVSAWKYTNFSIRKEKADGKRMKYVWTGKFPAGAPTGTAPVAGTPITVASSASTDVAPTTASLLADMGHAGNEAR